RATARPRSSAAASTAKNGPGQPVEMRPCRSTAVASKAIMPARLMANCIRCWRCQSDALPSLAEYWHMGDTAMRLGSSMGPSLSGEKRCGTANTPTEDEAEGKRWRKFPHPLLLNGPHGVYRAFPALWRGTYALTDERRSSGDLGEHGATCAMSVSGVLVAQPSSGQSGQCSAPRRPGVAPSGCQADASRASPGGARRDKQGASSTLTRSVSR